MQNTDVIDAHLAFLDWGQWDAARPPEIVHAIVPRDFSQESAPLESLLTQPREWHAVVNNLVIEADHRFGHRRWFDMQRHPLNFVSGIDRGAFRAYQSINHDERVATLYCYPDGTIISRSWIVGVHIRPAPRRVVAIEEIADSLASTMYFAAQLYATAQPSSLECVVRSALVSTQELVLNVPVGAGVMSVEQSEPTAFLRMPSQIELRSLDPYLEARLRSNASWQYCWERLKPLYRATESPR